MLSISSPHEGHIETHQFYDRPVLFASLIEGQFYAVVLLDDDVECETWLYAPCTEDRWKTACTSDAFRALFAESEGGIVIEAKSFFDDRPMYFTERLASSLDDDELPRD